MGLMVRLIYICQSRKGDSMTQAIRLRGVRENNLKNITVEIPYQKHTVIVGVSGSGKSTLAYDVLYATAQQKLLECMADQTKGFINKMKAPKVDEIEGLSTVISLKQVKPNHNPRSTIGSYTSIGAYMRNLMAVHGRCNCLFCDTVYEQSNLFSLVRELEGLKEMTIVEVCFPYFFDSLTSRKQQIEAFRKKGYRYIYINQLKCSLRDFIEVDETIPFILVVESRFQVAKKLKKSDINYIKSASEHGDHFISIHLSGDDEQGIKNFYRKFGCPSHHMITLSLDATDFSYNDISCACPECKGSGVKRVVHPSKVMKNPKKSLSEGPFFQEAFSMKYPYNYMLLYSLATHYGFSYYEPYETLGEAAKEVIMYGSKGEEFPLLRPEGYEQEIPNYRGAVGDMVSFEGVLSHIEDMYRWTQNTELTPAQVRFFNTYMHEATCPACQGMRLKKIKGYVQLSSKSFSELGRMEMTDLMQFIREIPTNEHSEPIVNALIQRLEFIKEIGLEYLSFERRIDTLSGGEYQRIRIANQLGSGLVGMTYIIDEPTDGLHGSDNDKVIGIIRRLVEKGNTVITIEHNLEVIKAADYIIEMGPGAGVNGGEVVACGTLEEIDKNPNSIIRSYLKEPVKLWLSNQPLMFDKAILLKGMTENNLKNVDIQIPLGKITCFTGVSGSGKSSVVHEVLYKSLYSRLQDSRVIPGKYSKILGSEGIKNVICINQSQIFGKNTSIPASFIDIFDGIRELFAASAEDGSEMRGDKGYFSFNSKGACPCCKGKGYIESYIQYYGDSRMVCTECEGKQYTEDVLQIKYHGKNIKQVLELTFSKALMFFEDTRRIHEKIQLVCDLGLGYMALGQPLSTVSGGEAQRLKLAKEMSRYKNTKNLIYIFDEPTVGLHTKDISYIINIMKRITSNQNTVVVVEHNPEVILNSDYIIDMGPGSGNDGGNVIFTGTPYELLERSTSKTAEYLRDYLS